MPQVSIEVLAAVEDAVSGLNRVDGVVDNLGGTSKKTGISMSDFNNAMEAGRKIYQAVEQAIGATVGKTVEYAEQVRDLSRAMGGSAEDASVLIQAGDDLNISFTTLRQATKKLNDEGIQPSIENLGNMADEYLRIQDPVERAQFAIDKFGLRAGPEMQKLLEKGSRGLDEMAESARAAGLIMSGETAAAARTLEIRLDELEEIGEGLALTIGTELLPVATDLIVIMQEAAPVVKTLAEGFVTAWEAADKLYKIEQLILLQLAAFVTGADDATVAMAAQLIINDGLTDSEVAQAKALEEGRERWLAIRDTYMHDVIPATDDLKLKTEELKSSYDDLSLAIEGPIGQANDDYYAQQKEAGAVIAELTKELDKLEASHGAVYTSTVDGTAAARNLIIAQSEAQIAAEKLKLSHEKLAEDPGDLGLQAAVARSEIALDTARGHVEEWGAKVSEVNATYVIDNSNAIDETNLKLAEANAAYDANAAAHEAATARIVFDMLVTRLGADGEFSAAEQAFLTDIGEAWGIYDESTAAALRAVDHAIATHGLNANLVIDSVTDNISNMPKYTLLEIEVRTNYTQYGAEPGPGAPVSVPSTPDDMGPPGGSW